MLVSEYLDQIQQKHGITSDYKLAQMIGVSRQAVSRYRKYNDTFSDEISLKVAKLLDIYPGEVLVDMHIQRAKRPDEKKAWKQLLKQLGTKVAALVLVLQGVMISPSDAMADTPASDKPPFCILCKIVRAWLASIRAAWRHTWPHIADAV